VNIGEATPPTTTEGKISNSNNHNTELKYKGFERETIYLKSGDWVKVDRYNNLRVNDRETYNPKYISVVGKTETQINLINRILGIKTETPREILDRELKQLTTIDYLKKKINTLNTHTEKYNNLKQYNPKSDRVILLGRYIEKSKTLISKYLNQLTPDSKFSISRIGDTYKIVYSGDYITATKKGDILDMEVF
jgi:hypothetical protein